jgi:hypothetical protein
MTHRSRAFLTFVSVAERASAYKAAARAHIKHNSTPMPSSPSKPLDTPLHPSQSENDSPTRPVSNSPRELVRRVVERTSDKLGRSKSLGSKSQNSPNPQRTSSNGTSKRFVSQGRKGKGPQTADTGDLGGTFNTCPSSACSALDLCMF